MSMIARATEVLRGVSAHTADKLQAFLSGYCGEPLDPGLDADPELHHDWEHGVHAHDHERLRVEAHHDVV